MVSFQAKEVEESIEGLLRRLEEFCALTDMVSFPPEVWVETQAQCLSVLGGCPGNPPGWGFSHPKERDSGASRATCTLCLPLSPTPNPKASSGSHLGHLLPPRWLSFHGGARRGPPGGTLGRRCGEPCCGDARAIFNFPPLCAVGQANMEPARKWLQAWEAWEGLAAQATARGGVGIVRFFPESFCSLYFNLLPCSFF